MTTMNDLLDTAKLIGREVTVDELGNITNWNPEESNDDAFQLMVALGMEVYVDTHPDGCQCVEVESHTHNSGRYIVNFRFTPDKMLATRTAIFLTACAVARNLYGNAM